MKSVLFFYLVLASLLTGSLARADFVQADLVTADQDVNRGTHIVIAGQGLEAGTAWIKAAQTQAMVYRDRKVHGAIRLLAAVDASKKDAYLALLNKWGYTGVRYFNQDFLGTNVVDALAAVPLVASLDFVGHDGAFLGLALQDENSNHRFYEKNVDAMVARVHFSKDSFIRLIGCNTGWFLAPYMAKKLGVPAEGTLTSADVQILGNDGAWYFDEAGSMPTGVSRAVRNSVSYMNAQNCVESAGCIRLKAINNSYHGQHGVYFGAVPFTKFFCGSAEQNDCFRRMALAARYVVSTSPMESANDFVTTLGDQFCPPELEASKSQLCHQEIAQHLAGQKILPTDFTTLPSQVPQLTCSFSNCEFKVTKDAKGRAILVSTGPATSSTFVDELNAYREGEAKQTR